MSRGKDARRAAALSFDADSDNAPRVSAAGSGLVAERILEAAREHGVPLREDPDLVDILAALDLGTEIPAELYTVIAEVLAWAYRTNASYASATARPRDTVAQWPSGPSPRETWPAT